MLKKKKFQHKKSTSINYTSINLGIGVKFNWYSVGKTQSMSYCILYSIFLISRINKGSFQNITGKNCMNQLHSIFFFFNWLVCCTLSGLQGEGTMLYTFLYTMYFRALKQIYFILFIVDMQCKSDCVIICKISVSNKMQQLVKKKIATIWQKNCHN